MPDDQSVVASADILLIGDRPDNLQALADEITLDPSQPVISLVAGVSIEQLNKLFGSVRNIRAMLSYAAEINRSTVVITPYDAAAEALLSRLGEIVPLKSEQEFELATVGACMNGWLYFLLDDLQHWLMDRGLKPEHARKLVLGNVDDCVAYARHHSSRALNELGRSIATPGTFTAEGLEMISLHQANAAWAAASELVLDALVAQSAGEERGLVGLGDGTGNALSGSAAGCGGLRVGR
jgi:pyrroline-5-carboxylate reductase